MLWHARGAALSPIEIPVPELQIGCQHPICKGFRIVGPIQVGGVEYQADLRRLARVGKVLDLLILDGYLSAI